MTIEAELVKHIIDVVLAALKKIKGVKVRRDAELDLGEVIRNLLQVSPDINGAEAKIQVVKAAGVISKELILAEEMLSSVQAKPRVVEKRGSCDSGLRCAQGCGKEHYGKETIRGQVRPICRSSIVSADWRQKGYRQGQVGRIYCCDAKMKERANPSCHRTLCIKQRKADEFKR